MSSVCAEHKLHPSHQLLLNKKALREIDIPAISPRRILGHRGAGALDAVAAEMFMDSPRAAEEALLQKFLPYNGGDEDENADPYSSDHFRMYEFKVRRCTRSRSHDWTDCPFAHPGEKARRRDPRRYHYSGTVCNEFRRGSCSRGDNCEFAHGVFETWLHPARYRTEACKDGKNCKRKVCFFAHSPRQLRILPPSSPSSPPMNPLVTERKYRNLSHCCVFCHSVTPSPTSTLMGMSHQFSPPMSPSLSPPLSPMKSRSISGLSPISRYGDRFDSADSFGLSRFKCNPLSYSDILTELMNSLESMNVSEASSPATFNRDVTSIDVPFNNGDDQQQFILSPTTPTPSRSREFSRRSFIDEKLNDINGSPDLGWVNDLLT